MAFFRERFCAVQQIVADASLIYLGGGQVTVEFALQLNGGLIAQKLAKLLSGGSRSFAMLRDGALGRY
jgi:hypothetical protein